MIGAGISRRAFGASHGSVTFRFGDEAPFTLPLFDEGTLRLLRNLREDGWEVAPRDPTEGDGAGEA